MFVADLAGDGIELDPADEHHLRRVLRLRAGEPVSVSDGRGAWRWARVAADGLEPAGDVETVAAPEPPITVAFALVKGDRPEWIVQKLTELGVDVVIPFESARTVVRWRDTPKAGHHLARLRKVAREAAMQSRRVHLPEIAAIRSVDEVFADPAMAAAEPGGDPPTPGITALAIGPEGGFTSAELALARQRVALPGAILRSDTAAISAGVVLALGRQKG